MMKETMSLVHLLLICRACGLEICVNDHLPDTYSCPRCRKTAGWLGKVLQGEGYIDAR